MVGELPVCHASLEKCGCSRCLSAEPDRVHVQGIPIPRQAPGAEVKRKPGRPRKFPQGPVAGVSFYKLHKFCILIPVAVSSVYHIASQAVPPRQTAFCRQMTDS